MPAHPFVGFEPLSPGFLLGILERFLPTLIVFAAVALGAFLGRRRRRRLGPLGRRLEDRLRAGRRRVPALAVGRSGLWALPLLAWAWQAARWLEATWFQIHHWRAPVVLGALFEFALVLGLLLVAQSLCVLALDRGRGSRLGVTGGQRVAVRFAIATVFLDGFLYAWILGPA